MTGDRVEVNDRGGLISVIPVTDWLAGSVTDVAERLVASINSAHQDSLVECGEGEYIRVSDIHSVVAVLGDSEDKL